MAETEQPQQGAGTLKQWREARGISQAELAHRAGTVPSTIYAVEGGWTEPRVLLAQRIARALNVRTDDIEWWLRPSEERAKHRKRPPRADGATEV